jgi:hypothetical protein
MKKTFNDLWALREESVSIDKNISAEQKSNVLLYAGEHYTRQGSRFWNSIRNNQNLDNSTKIRITKNHIQKICKNYVDNILTLAPGVSCMPKNKTELQDQKAAQLCNAVWQDVKHRRKLDKKIDEFCNDFVIQGEVATKIFWNPNLGEHIGYDQAIDEKTGEPIFKEDGSPAQGRAIFSGDFEYERLFSFNLRRPPGARSMDDAQWLGYDKMVDIPKLKEMVGNDKDKLKLISETKDETYIVFDPVTGKYVDSKNQCLIFEMYWRPSPDFPNGYYYYCTPTGVLFEGELPAGVFPIVYEGFDELESTPRHYSIIKVARPYQAEINRCASKIVEHQITIGDDKILTQSGTKLTQGGVLPGVRNLQYAGEPPTILPGRSGDQYDNYMAGIISEMYAVCRMAEDMEEKPAQMDPQALLYASMRQKKRYSKYACKFERFLVNVCEVTLKLAKEYYTEQNLIPAIGRSEMVNVDEFKNTTPLNYQIKVDPASDDSETKLGKLMQITTILQYVGTNLKPEDIGKLFRMMPYVNEEEAFKDLTLDYDNATNDILALDAGRMPPPRQYDNHEYQIKRLSTRMSEPDFVFLSEQVKLMYQDKITEHEEIKAAQAAELQRAAAGFIPSGGPLTPVDLYVQDPTSPKKTQRARVPYEAIIWLLQKLEEQGQSQAVLQNMSQGVQAEIARMLPSQGQGDSSLPQTAPPMEQPYMSGMPQK